MSEIERLLDDYRDAGVGDSEGAFTIDFAKAREKLAKFQLPDPHELVLKFVQAGNLASQGVSIAVRKSTLSITYQDWSPELTLQKLADRLASASLIVGDDPLSHLSIGLSALLGLGCEVRARQALPGEKQTTTLVVGQALEWSQEDDGLTGPLFELSAKMPDGLSSERLGKLLAERCVFSRVPVSWQGARVEALLPQPIGAHRPAFFRENKVLAQSFTGDGRMPLLTGPVPSRGKGDRTAHLSLTVDLDPKATVWLCKAGVMAEKKHLDVGIPGIIGVVTADEVPTDLTGSQFLEGESLKQVEAWLRVSGRTLLSEAIAATKNVVSEAQPASSNAPIATRFACSGCLIALLGWMAGVAIINNTRDSSGWIMPNLFFWILFPIGWVWFAIWRHGCEKDDKSDAAARRQLLGLLQSFQSR